MGFQTHISSVSCIGRRVLYHDHHQGNPDSKINKILSSVQSLSRVRLFATPWTAARQVSLSFTNGRSLLKLTCIELLMPSNHLILCCPLLFLPSVFPSIRVFSSESVLHIQWPKMIRASASSEYSGLISFRIDSFDLVIQGTLTGMA